MNLCQLKLRSPIKADNEALINSDNYTLLALMPFCLERGSITLFINVLAAQQINQQGT